MARMIKLFIRALTNLAHFMIAPHISAIREAFMFYLPMENHWCYHYNECSNKEENIMDITTQNEIKSISVKAINPTVAQEVFRALDAPFSKQDAKDILFFAARNQEKYVGLITVKSSTDYNAHIDQIIINPSDYFQLIATKLLLTVEDNCYNRGLTSITFETSAPKQYDNKDLQLYFLCESLGYKPLFEMHAHSSVYMQKIISLNDFIFIDLTHSLSSTVPHWGLDVGFKYNARFVSNAESPEKIKFRVQRLEMSAGIGTHMDAPSHCFEEGLAIDAIPLQSLITVCRVIDVSSKIHEKYSVTTDDILFFEDTYGLIPKGAFVIIYMGWDERWKQPEKYRNNKIFPSISLDAAKLLLSREIVGLGTDTLSPDAFGSDFPVHQLILGAGKYIIENVANAKQLDPTGSYIFALPIKIVDGTEAPVRLIGMKRKNMSY